MVALEAPPITAFVVELGDVDELEDGELELDELELDELELDELVVELGVLELDELELVELVEELAVAAAPTCRTPPGGVIPGARSIVIRLTTLRTTVDC
jgi:hypothetical protein